MSVSSVGASSNAYSYLQSLLQQGSGTSGTSAVSADPLTSLLSSFYPGGATDPSASAPASGTGGCPPFSPETMGTLISMQGQQSGATDPVTSKSQSLFEELDTNGDGQITQSEFETDFGSGADTSKVDGLFNALDANGDGSVSEDEFTSAAKASHAHHHHHMHGGGGSGQGGGLADLLSATDATGATSQTSSNADGSTTTTISYADGSTVVMTNPAAADTSGNSKANGSSSQADTNLLEQLIKMQAQMFAQASNSLTSTLSVI